MKTKHDKVARSKEEHQKQAEAWEKAIIEQTTNQIHN